MSAGVARDLLELPRWALALGAPGLARALGAPWGSLRNRGDTLVRDRDQGGWLNLPRRGWSTPLRFAERHPRAARRLLSLALADWPVRFAEAPAPAPGLPEVSFVIGHRGDGRVPLLLTTLASVAAQEGASVEAVVVEQAVDPMLSGRLPPWCRYVASVPPRADLPYSRSWAFNVGAREARGRILVLHDNDVCVPARYAAELVRLDAAGFEGARLQRFVFYLDAPSSDVVVSARRLDRAVPAAVVQNCEGHSLALRREAYAALGGHDETFLGWGGEDNEVFDRCLTLRFHDHAYLPMLHLHHPPQPGKDGAKPNQSYFEERMAIPAARRIEELAARPWGRREGPLG